MLKIIEHEQGSEAWLNWRVGKIGGSLASSIMGCGYLTPYDAWLSCLGLHEQKMTSAMQRGSDLEPIARRAFEEEHGGIFPPACVEHETIPELIASLDGLSLDKTEILEIKCTTKKNFELALKGQIPDNFLCQIYHQLMVTGLERAWYYCFDGEKGASVLVKRDEEFIKNLLEKEMEFLDQVRRREPPALSDKDYTEREDHEWEMLARQYVNVDKQLKDLEEQKQALRLLLEAQSSGRSCRGGGISLSHGFRASAPDYKRIVTTLGIETQGYEKPPIKTVIIRIQNV